MRNYKHLFGPVPSRRLGRSLGVDIIPFKLCSFDCVFCQLGRTTDKTLLRKEYLPVNNVVKELDHWLKNKGNADHITISGSGEPTLNSHFGDVIKFARATTNIPVVLLTNGSMLHLPEVRTAASHANIVKVSLSAWDHSSFEHINRPDQNLALRSIVEGLSAFRNQFDGQLWIEVFIVGGMNSTTNDVMNIAALAKTLSPHRIQLNTAVRPTAEEFVQAMPRQEMERLTKLFDPPAEVIAEFSVADAPDIQANEKTVLAMLQRRPCTGDGISHALGLHLNEVSKYLGKLEREGAIQAEHREGTAYYKGTPETITGK